MSARQGAPPSVVLPRHAVGGDRHGAARGCELDRVGKEVVENLLQLAGIGFDHRQLLPITCASSIFFASACGRMMPTKPSTVAHASRLDVHLHSPGLDLRHVEQFVDHLEQRAAAGKNVADVATALGIDICVGLGDLLEQFREADDRVQRRAELVADVGEELALETVGFVEPDVASASSLSLRSRLLFIARSCAWPCSRRSSMRVERLGELLNSSPVVIWSGCDQSPAWIFFAVSRKLRTGERISLVRIGGTQARPAGSRRFPPR